LRDAVASIYAFWALERATQAYQARLLVRPVATTDSTDSSEESRGRANWNLQKDPFSTQCRLIQLELNKDSVGDADEPR